MSFVLSDRQWAEIVAYQTEEIERLCTDPDYTLQCGRTLHYSRITELIVQEQGRRVLELGCGPGRYVAILAGMGFEVLGVDPVQYAGWERIKELAPSAAFQSGIRAESLPFNEESFDQAVCIGSLLYFQDVDKALTELHRVVRPGGRALFRTVNRGNLYKTLTGRSIDPMTKYEPTMREFTIRLEEFGFCILETFSYGFYPPIAPGLWWYLVNGKISLRTQQFLSTVCPAPWRVNIMAFCERR